MNKIIEGAKQALETARCKHELVVQPRLQTTAPPTLERYYCTKCHATLYIKLECQ